MTGTPSQRDALQGEIRRTDRDYPQMPVNGDPVSIGQTPKQALDTVDAGYAQQK